MNYCINVFMWLLFFGVLAYGQPKDVVKETPEIFLTEESNDAFAGGEWFQFRIHYGFINASYASLSLEEKEYNGEPVFHAVGIGRTVGFARWFFKVEDRYESFFKKDVISPVHFIRDIDEGGYTKDVTIDFDESNHTANVHDKKRNTRASFITEPNVQDLISAFYYLRNHFDTTGIKEGEFVSINMFFDNENFKFKLKFLGHETINSKFGKIKCLKLRPYVQSGRVFRESESLTLWVSNDKNKLPVKVRADLAVGSIDADLNAFKGLKHSFRIEIDE